MEADVLHRLCGQGRQFEHVENHRIVVVGGSAGGVEALRELVNRLPPKLPAPLLVVLHLPAAAPSELATILDRAGPLPAHQATMGQELQPGHIYAAPPDRHLILEDGKIHLWRGPKENRQRPSVNVLFRSAAVTYGSRAIGIILSGTLDDGTTGLWWIKRYGGTAVVQDPSEATFPNMIYSALEHVEVDHIVGVAKMGKLLANLTDEKAFNVAHPGRATAVSPKWRRSET